MPACIAIPFRQVNPGLMQFSHTSKLATHTPMDRCMIGSAPDSGTGTSAPPRLKAAQRPRLAKQGGRTIRDTGLTDAIASRMSAHDAFGDLTPLVHVEFPPRPTDASLGSRGAKPADVRSRILARSNSTKAPIYIITLCCGGGRRRVRITTHNHYKRPPRKRKAVTIDPIPARCIHPVRGKLTRSCWPISWCCKSIGRVF
jgi:hypothetical protein